MGYRLNRLHEPVFMAVSKPLLTEFGIHHRLESCEGLKKKNQRFSLSFSGKGCKYCMDNIPGMAAFMNLNSVISLGLTLV